MITTEVLLRRTVILLRRVLDRSDRLQSKGCPRTPQVQREYDAAKILIRDIDEYFANEKDWKNRDNEAGFKIPRRSKVKTKRPRRAGQPGSKVDN